MFHCFRTINLFGSEEIFTNSYYTETCTVSSISLSCYIPTKLSYNQRVKSSQGVGYLIIAILAIIYYLLIFFAHKKCIKKILGCNAIFTKPIRGNIPVTALRDRNLAFKPHSYRFDKMDKYKAAIHAVEAKMHDNPLSPNQVRQSMNVDSHYDLKSDANSGELVAGGKMSNNQVFNIYKRPDTKDSQFERAENFDEIRVASEVVDEIELQSP